MAFDILPKLVKPIHASSPKFDGVWSCQAQTDWSGPAQVGSAQSLSECSRALQGLRLGADPPRALARRAARAAQSALYALTLVASLGISAAYNMWPVGPLKWRLRRFDLDLMLEFCYEASNVTISKEDKCLLNQVQ